MRKDKALILFSYALVYIVWGSTYFFVKVAGTTIPAALVVALRFIVGSLILVLLAWKRGAFKQLPTLKEAAGSVLIGVFLLFLGNGLITIAVKTIPSYFASLIAACMPFYVAFFNFMLYRTKVSRIRFSGTFVGILGIGALLFNGTSLAGTLSPALLLAVAGALAWGFGTSIAAKLPKAKDPFLSTAIQMAAAGIGALCVGLAVDPSIFAKLGQTSSWSWFGVSYLAVIGSLAMVAYNHLLAHEPSFRISSYALVNPLIAVFLGLASGEQATPYLFLGVPLVLAGLALMLYGDALLERMRG
jgi:drug/metabolite transporter (DMT)-like permease